MAFVVEGIPYIGGNTHKEKYDFFCYEENKPFNMKLYHANIDLDNLPSPIDMGTWKEIKEQRLINKIKQLNGEGETVETVAQDFQGCMYHHNSPSDGSLSAFIEGGTLINILGDTGSFKKDTNENGVADKWVYGSNLKNLSFSVGEQSFTGAGDLVNTASNWLYLGDIFKNLSHKYYARFIAKSNIVNTELEFGNGYNIQHSQTIGTNYEFVSNVFTPTQKETRQDYFTIASTNITAIVTIKEVIIIDLTAMFGSDNEPDKEWCDKNIPYFEGMKSTGEVNYVNGKYIGKNIFDGYLENGYINSIDGTDSSDNKDIAFRSKYIKLEPSTNYILSGIDITFRTFTSYYTKDKTYIDRTNGIYKDIDIIKTPANAKYVRFTCYGFSSKDSRDTKKDSIKIQLEKGSTLTPYEEYYEGCKIEALSTNFKNELIYNPNTWVEWSATTGIIKDSSGMEFTLTNPLNANLLNTNFKSNTKYGVLYNIVSNTLTTGTLSTGNELFGTWLPFAKSGMVGNIKNIFTTQKLIINNKFRLTNGALENGAKVKIKDIRFYELPTGSQIEKDFETLSSDELSNKYNLSNEKEDKTEILTKEPLRKVGAIKDYMNSIAKVKRYIGNHILQKSDIRNIWDGNAEFTVALVDLPLNSDIAWSTSKVIVEGWTGDNSERGLGKYMLQNSFEFALTKGTTLEQAREQLEGTKMIYVLKNPNYESPLSYENSLPNGTQDQTIEGNGVWKLSDGSVSVKGEFYKQENVGEILVDGSQDFSLAGIQKNPTYISFYYRNPLMTSNGEANRIYCDNMEISIPSLWGDPQKEAIRADMSGNAIYISIQRSKLTTENVDGLKEYLKNNPISISYEKLKPTQRLLTEEEKAEYLAKKDYLNNSLILNSYANGNIIIDSIIPPSKTKITYNIDTEDTNILSLSCQEVGKNKAILIEVDMSDITNDLYEGNNSDLKNALKTIINKVYMGKGTLGTFNDVSKSWDLWSNNTTQNIVERTNARGQDLSGTNPSVWINNQNKIYIILINPDIATDSVPSTVNIDYCNADVDIERSSDVVNPIDVELGSEWSIISKFNPSWSDTTDKTRVIFCLYKDSYNYEYLQYSNVTKLFGYIKHIDGVNHSIYSSVQNFDEYQNISFIISRINGITLRLSKYNSNVENIMSINTKQINGECKLYVGHLGGHGYQADAFLNSLYFLNNKTFTDSEAETILKGRPPIGEEEDKNLILLSEQFKNPNLIPKFNILNKDNNQPLWVINDDALVSEDGGTLNLNNVDAWKDNSLKIPILPNNKYKLKFNTKGLTGYCYIREYRHDYEVDLHSNIGYNTEGDIEYDFTPNEYTNNIIIHLNNSGSGTFTFSDLELRRIDY